MPIQKRCERGHTNHGKWTFRLAEFSIYHPNVGTQYSCALHLSTVTREVWKAKGNTGDMYIHTEIINEQKG